MSRIGSTQFFLLVVSVCLWGQLASAKPYYRSDEPTELVQNKLYTKSHRFELNLPDVGLILNQTFIDSTVLHGNLLYYISESWGFGVDALYSHNQDKEERHCIENFYNSVPQHPLAAPCPSQGEDPKKHLFDSAGKPIRGANLGPAYVPIREIESILLAAAVWSPFYGKQLALFSQTIYFDLFLTFGVGVTLASFYPESRFLRDGKLSRGDVTAPLPEAGCVDGANYPGVCPSNPNLDSMIGAGGRPAAQLETLPTAAFGIGQKFHFLKRFNFHVEVRDYVFQGTATGISNVVTLWGGLGVRL